MANKLDDHVATYQGANPYDFDNEIILNWYPQRIMQNSKGAASMLELGLGHGFTANIFSDQYPRHVVLEGSPAVIDNFRSRFPQCKAEIVETYFELFDTAERFDVIVMGFILEHVDDPLLVISRFRQFLAPGGKMFLAVPNAEAMNRRLGQLAGFLDDIEELSENDVQSGHQRYYTVKTLTDDIVRAACKVDRMEGIYLKPFTTSQIVSLNFGENVLQAMCELGVAYPELSLGILAQISAA